MAGRAPIGVVVGGFWSMSAATAMRLVPARQVPRALAVFNSGNALATVVAAPLGSYPGSVIGWHGAFFCLVPVALIALTWQWISLPSMRFEQRSSCSRNVFALFRSPVVTLGMLAVRIFFMGQFTLFTYVRPFLETVTRVDVSALSLILLVLGVTGVFRLQHRAHWPTQASHCAGLTLRGNANGRFPLVDRPQWVACRRSQANDGSCIASRVHEAATGARFARSHFDALNSFIR